MSAALIQQLREHGVHLSSTGETIKYRGPEQAVKEFLPVIREKKVELLKVMTERKQRAGEPISYIEDVDALFDVEPYIYDNKIRRLFIDTETEGLDPFSHDLVLVQIKAGEKIFLIDVGKIGTGHHLGFNYHGVERILEDGEILKVFHNAPFDLKFLRYHLFPKIRFRNIFDTLLAEKVLTAGIFKKKGEHALESVAKRYLNVEMDKTEQTGFLKGQDLTESQIKYAVNDVEVLEGIFDKQKHALLEAGLIPTAKLEFSIIPAVIDIELAGMCLDNKKLELLREDLTKTEDNLVIDLQRIIKDVAQGDQKKINFNSPIQVKKLLSKLGYNVSNTKKETLEKIDCDFAGKMIQYRKTSKLLSSFVQTCLKNYIFWI